MEGEAPLHFESNLPTLSMNDRQTMQSLTTQSGRTSNIIWISVCSFVSQSFPMFPSLLLLWDEDANTGAGKSGVSLNARRWRLRRRWWWWWVWRESGAANRSGDWKFPARSLLAADKLLWWDERRSLLPLPLNLLEFPASEVCTAADTEQKMYCLGVDAVCEVSINFWIISRSFILDTRFVNKMLHRSNEIETSQTALMPRQYRQAPTRPST